MKKDDKKKNIIDKARLNLEKRKKNQDGDYKDIYKIINSFKFRIFILMFFTAIGFAIIIGNLYKLQIKEGKKWREDGEKQYSSENYIKPKRGKISTNDGQVLAYDNEEFVVVLDPTLIEEKNIDFILEMLKRYIGEIDTGKYKSEYLKRRESKRKYLKIEHKISRDIKVSIEGEIDSEKKEVENDKEHKLKRRLIGVTFETVFTRNYVKNDVFQETIGFVNNENSGVYGIEKYYDKQLAGEVGIIKGLKIPKAFLNLVNVKNKEASRPVKDGNNIVLTLDSVMQYALDEELQRAFEEYNATSTMGILIEVETGKVLAMSSYPKADDKANIKNRPITDLFEPGSIFKPVTVSMGLQSRVINPNTRIVSAGSIRVQDRIISDHDSSTTGSLTLADAIAYSGNVAMVKIAQMIDKNNFHNYLSDIGLGERTGIDTYSEKLQKLLKSKDLTEVKKANIAFGQGISMTQIQTIMVLNTVVNNGKLMKPYMVDRIEDSKGNIVQQNKPTVLKKVFSDEVSRLNRRYMEAVVNRGTGRGAYISGYRVGGKTGTAQKSGVGGYTKGKYFSSFFAFFPVDNPKYALLITVNEPKGGKYYGASVALPSVKTVLEKLIEYKRISPDGKIKEEKKEIEIIKEEQKKDLNKIKQDFAKNVMPNLIGISLREFLSVYPQGKFSKYQVSGSGKIVQQVPNPGEKLDRNTNIQIVLE